MRGLAGCVTNASIRDVEEIEESRFPVFAAGIAVRGTAKSHPGWIGIPVRVGGVGINLAIQDAVATANLLIPPLRRGAVLEKDLRAVQRRREWPAKATQWLQVQIQNRLFSRVLSANERVTLPKFFTLFGRSALLRRIPAYVIGVGFRPEHVHQKPSTSA